MREFGGRVAVVTGAASGIGLALAERFAAEQMKVVLADVDEPGLAAAAAGLRAAGAQVIGVPADVSRASDVEELAVATLGEFGAVHVVCNNAGVDTGAPFAEIPLAAWDWVFGVNFFGVLHGCRTFLPLIREQGEGHIVNTGSIAGLTGFLPTATPYVASKFAVLGLSENLQHELELAGEPIGVSILCPAFVNTRMPEAERNRPPGVPPLDDHPKRRPVLDYARASVAAGLPASEVAGQVVDAIREQRFFVLPNHADAVAAVQARIRWMTENVSPPPRAGRPGI